MTVLNNEGSGKSEALAQISWLMLVSCFSTCA
jgi:hypothetical protein